MLLSPGLVAPNTQQGLPGEASSHIMPGTPASDMNLTAVRCYTIFGIGVDQ